MREFRDAAGAEWRVFRATPHTSPSKREKVLPESYRHGWLVFECDAERRRLAPVPDGWEELAALDLERLCGLADVVPTRGARPLAGDRKSSRRRSGMTPMLAAQAQEMLAQVIDEVCEQPRAPSLDTGELIKVQETLAIAARAAQEAVSLRRAMREGEA